MSVPKATTATFTQDQLRKIQDTPGNVLYDYEYDTVARVLTVPEVKAHISDVMKAYKKLRADRPELSDDACRLELCEDTSISLFRRSHPMVFNLCTKHDATNKDFQVLFLQLNLREQVEAGAITQDQASLQMQAMIIEQCKTGMTQAQWDQQQKDA